MNISAVVPHKRRVPVLLLQYSISETDEDEDEYWSKTGNPLEIESFYVNIFPNNPESVIDFVNL